MTEESIRIAAIVLVIKRPCVTGEPVIITQVEKAIIDAQSDFHRLGFGAMGCLSANLDPRTGSL